MTYGIRDSWALWGARRVVRSLGRAGTRPASGFTSKGGVRYTWKVDSVNIYDAKLNNMLKGPQGEVARFMRRIGREIQTLSKAQVKIRSGRLRNSIRVTEKTLRTERAIGVGSKVRYAYLHHEGTRPHLIVPVRRTHLKFRSGARIVFAKSVLHPGTKPNPYLSRPMRLVVLSLRNRDELG
jgi:hypothetical protein